MLYAKTSIQSKQSRLKAFTVHKKGDPEDRTLQSDDVHSFIRPTNNNHILKWNILDAGQTFRTSNNIGHIDPTHNNSLGHLKNLRKLCLCSTWLSDEEDWTQKKTSAARQELSKAFHQAIGRMFRIHIWFRMHTWFWTYTWFRHLNPLITSFSYI